MMPETPVLHAAGRTVRDAVESAPGTFGDAWCRQLIAHLLRAVESQHASQRPHRIIMPDTVIVQDDGAAELLAPLDDDAPIQPPMAADLKAIAAVAHFAISGESPPAAPLLPRGLPAFQDDLLSAIDACLYGDRNTRPQSVDDMRRLLGLAVTVAPAAPETLTETLPESIAASPAAAPSVSDELEEAIAGLAAAVGVEASAQPVPEPLLDKAPPPARQTTRTPWLLLACLAASILGAGGFALYEKGRQAGAEAVLAATPQPVVAPAAAREVAPAPAAAVASAPVTAPAPTLASITYQLRIRPWGEVHVDGIKRGISPPLKTLTLTGEHTVRIDHPAFPSHEIKVGTANNNSNRIDHDFR